MGRRGEHGVLGRPTGRDHGDVLHAAAAFEHVSDPLATLAECRRILKPGGLLGLATPNGRSLGSRWFGRSWRGLTPPWHLHLFGPRSLRQVLHGAGFRVVALRTTAVSAHWIYPVSKQIREGTYGRCEVCGQPIAPERLAARPVARTCIACASRR